MHYVLSMHYVYFIQSVHTKQLYIGRTNNIIRRLREHNEGNTFSTRKYAPWVLVYLEGYFSMENAVHRERTLKQFGKVYSQLKRRIQKSILSAQKVRG